MITCVFATNNPGKITELNAISKQEGVEFITLSDLRLVFEAEESGTTFEENALQKATETAALLKASGHSEYIVLADDSGIEIDALNGQPGIHSKYFIDAKLTSKERNEKVLEMLANTSERAARFVCVIACVTPDGKIFTTRSAIEGVVSETQKGENGFAYDPVFFIPELGKTMAEISREEKNNISHRGKALRKMIKKLKKEVL